MTTAVWIGAVVLFVAVVWWVARHYRHLLRGDYENASMGTLGSGHGGGGSAQTPPIVPESGLRDSSALRGRPETEDGRGGNVGIMDWLERRATQNLDTWCRQQYRRRLESPQFQALNEQARRAGWEDERIIWEFHVNNWPNVVHEAAQKMGRHAPRTVHRLTQTRQGKETETLALVEAFRAQGFDTETINSAIVRGNDGEFD